MYMFTILWFLISTNLFTQSLDDIKKAKDIQNQLESGEISPSEAIDKAKDMGASESQIKKAKKQLKSY